MRFNRRLPLAAAAIGAVLALSACAGDDALEAEDTGGEGGGGGESITVGGANFSEQLILQEIYGQLLEDAGFTVDNINVDSREIYFESLKSGEIDVVPEYAATLAEFLNVGANGAEAPPIATNDAAETVAAMEPLVEAEGITLLEPTEAADFNGFAVTAEYKETNQLETLSDLGALGQPIVLAATEECIDRPFCEGGLESVYGITVSETLPTGFGSPQTKTAVQDGQAQLGLVASTDGTLDQFDLELLEDDQSLQLAENIVPAVNSESLTPEIEEALNVLVGVLTTEELIELNRLVDSERQQAADVAEQWLTENELIG